MLARAFNSGSSRQTANDQKSAIQSKIKSASLDINTSSGVRDTSKNGFSSCVYHEPDNCSSSSEPQTSGPRLDQKKQLNISCNVSNNGKSKSDKSKGSNAKLKSSSNSSLHQKAKNFLSLSPGPLKASSSTSCLFSEDESSSSARSGSSSLINMPTRASLTHEWKKLKTPNKCRECNLLVYFNGRECSFCGFVAHKKCVTVLVIKCSGQQVTTASNRSSPSGRDHTQSDSPRSRAAQLFSIARPSAAISATNLAEIGSDDASTGSSGRKSPSLSLLSSSSTSRFQSSRASSGQISKSSKGSQLQVRPIFGQPIELDSFQLIDFIKRFIYEIDSRGLTSKGIYRVSSIKSKVDKLCNYYDQNLSSLIDLSSFHPNIIANALKMYLRQLPEPLLTHQLYHHFIRLAKNYPSPKQDQQQQQASRTPSPIPKNPKFSSPTPSAIAMASHQLQSDANQYNPMLIVDIREILDLLPPINREIVAIIMRHLKRVSDMSESNQMSAKNLSIIFGPTLLTASDKSQAIADNIHQARVVEIMILWADQIFPMYSSYESKAVIELNLSRNRRSAQSKKGAKSLKPGNLTFEALSSDKGLESQNPAQNKTILQIPVVDVTPDTDECNNIEFCKFQSNETETKQRSQAKLPEEKK